MLTSNSASETFWSKIVFSSSWVAFSEVAELVEVAESEADSEFEPLVLSVCDWLSEVEFSLLSDVDSEIACDNSAEIDWDTDCDTETDASVLAWASTEEFVDSWLVDATAEVSKAGAALNTTDSELAATSWLVVTWLSKAGVVVSSAWAV